LKSILGLETLVEHNAKAVRLTEAGRVFLTEARAALERVAEAVQTAKAVSGGHQSELHVGYAPSLTTRLLPRALKFFQEANPGVRATLSVRRRRSPRQKCCTVSSHELKPLSHEGVRCNRHNNLS